MSTPATTTSVVPYQPPQQTPQQLLSMAKVFAESRLFADAADAAKAVVKMQAAQEFGFGPFAGMTGVYIVKGRVTLSANLMAAAIQRYRGGQKYRFRVPKLTSTECHIQFQERQADGTWEVIGTSTFTMEDAKAAGLAGSDTYRKFPRNMLYARAMSNGARWYCAEVFGGSAPYTPDELDPRARITEDNEYVLDAEVVSGPSPGEQAAAGDELLTLIAQTGTDMQKFLKHHAVSSLSQLTPEARATAAQNLKAKLSLQNPRN